MNFLAWLSPGRWLLIGALLAALVLGYFAWADHIGDVREGQVRAQYAKQAKAVDDARAAIAPPIAARQEARQEKIRTVFKTIIKEVPTYVSINDCAMSPGFRVFHDAAANGEVPDAARIADAAAVAAPDVANTVAANYQACHTNSARLTGLQEWVRAQQVLKAPP
ncbi:hypothetical protein [Polaromonas sp.]|uniref:hypothetical protein n=1 Tax=Polaromonas sp. TaxID=1869339 RepID=UPI003753C5B6